MKVLIVEDDPNKLTHLVQVVETGLAGCNIVQRRSYQSGLKEALTQPPSDIVILDMTMPTYDVSGAEGGGRTRVYAGKEIIRELARRAVRSRVVIVTQFESFGEGEHRKTLEELRREVAAEFPSNYAGTVFYHPAQTNWREELLALCR